MTVPLRQWREQARQGVLDPAYVEHLRERRQRFGTARGKRRWIGRAKSMNSRARRCGAVGKVTADDLILLVISYGSRCAYCGTPLDFTGRPVSSGVLRGTFDHVKPLSRGGRGDVSNLAPACGPCNSTRATWPDAALGVPAPHRFALDALSG